ncbi:unchacterized apicomplexan-specific serine rich low complexity protein [Cystoisospora suis]|uniref:Unchacterized apicomplexan-specific serine rich low complexity protein n=1 Tax=Cystoisospora suis TaxID=483139 RepID=A0A2C6JGC5_9APIC|nr:unchacterized apicomplexan-specific serine rich low complexity protein [Cystoisospora suis]
MFPFLIFLSLPEVPNMEPSPSGGTRLAPVSLLPGTPQRGAEGSGSLQLLSAASASTMSVSDAPHLGENAPFRRRIDSDDDSPIKPKPAMKSKLLSDSEDEVPVRPSRLTPQLATPDSSQGKFSNGKSPTPARQRAKSAALAGSAARGVHSSEGSSDSGSSSGSSSSDRSSSVSSSGSDSSDSSEGSSSESQDERENERLVKKPRKDDKKPMPKRKQPSPVKAKPPPRTTVSREAAASRSKSRDGSDDEGDGADISMGTFDPRNRNTRAKLVAQLLCRWWYVMPEWPPPDFNYEAELRKRRLKLVTLEEYEDLDDVDEQGFTKVYQISAFPGVFRDPNGNAIDLRPAEGRPCYSNLTKKTEYELLQLVEVAIKNQMEKLKESVYDERATHKKLQAELVEVSKELQRHRLREEMLKSKKGTAVKAQ